jgi:hypothetical protein
MDGAAVRWYRLAAGVVANGFSFQPAVKSEIEVLTSAHDR